MPRKPQKPATHLNPRRRRFALEYLVDLNGAQAAIRAGYSKRTAKAIASELLDDPLVKDFIDDALRKREEKLEIKADRVLQELARVALVDLGQAFDEDGKLKPLQDIPEDVRRAIAAVEIEEDWRSGTGVTQTDDGIEVKLRPTSRVAKVRFWSKPEALVALGKHLKLFAERIEHSGPNGGPIQKVVEVAFVEPDTKPQPS